jgi:hypothetical protein
VTTHPLVSVVTDKLAGHVRLGAAGNTEFAAGYDDIIVPRSIVAALSRSVAPSSGWMLVYATPSSRNALEITACSCDAPRRFLPPDLRLRLR